MRKILRIFSILVLLAAVFILGGYLFYSSAINKKNSNFSEIKKFTIQNGESSEDISKRLREEGLIQNSFIFDMYAWQTKKDDKLRAGEYDIPKNISIKEIIGILSSMRALEQNKITIIEGWENTEIAQYLEDKGVSKKNDFLYALKKRSSWWDDYEALWDLPKGVDLEGYLFPDTYLVFKNASIDDILKKMISNLDKKIDAQMRRDIKEQNMNIHKILTLASIIEKEVAGGEDRAIVSGIFHKRLKEGMGLQADSTINYITGKSKARSSLDDISLDNPYNTYKYRGLPPGPINNPGLSAIRAAVYPKDSFYYYFLTTPEGAVIYSKNFEEHVAAKKKFLK